MLIWYFVFCEWPLLYIRNCNMIIKTYLIDALLIIGCLSCSTLHVSCHQECVRAKKICNEAEVLQNLSELKHPDTNESISLKKRYQFLKRKCSFKKWKCENCTETLGACLVPVPGSFLWTCRIITGGLGAGRDNAIYRRFTKAGSMGAKEFEGSIRPDI